MGKTEVEPEEFYGHPLDFDDWECDFNSYIQSMRIEDTAEKIRHLKKYVNGESKEVL